MNIFRCAFPMLLAFAAVSVSAQEIGKVSFQQEGSTPYSEDILRNNVQTKKGLMFSERIVNDDVRRLYSLGVFSDVVSVVENLSDGKKAVTFRVSPKPIVTKILFEGNKKYSTKKLMEFVSLPEGTPLNDKLLVDSSTKLRKFYQEEGLNDAQISSELVPDGNGFKVIFRIVENLRLRVNKVHFNGAKLYKESEMRDVLETRYSPLSVDWLAWLPLHGGMGLLDRDALQRDRVRLRELYWRKGYLDFKITDVKVEEMPGNPELVNVTFTIEEGEPYFVRNIAITGNSRFSEEELREHISLIPNNVYSSTKEDADVQGIEGKYRPLGYADFMIRVNRKPDFESHSVDLEYDIREGTQYTIGEVYISGNKYTKEHVIRREILLFPDDPVDQSLIDVTKNRLLGMGYFEGESKDDKGVEIVTVNTEDPTKKDVHINLRERRFIDGKIGAGWSDTDSLAGMIELSHSNVDILDPWNYFTGGGQRVRVLALAGLEHMGVEANFIEPWLFNIPLRLELSGYWREVIYDEWSERRIGFSASLTKRIIDDFTSISAGYTFEQVRVYDMARRLSPVFQNQKGNELVGRFHLTLDRDTRNSATNPTSGYDVSAHAAITTRGLGATQDYYKFELKGINYYPFFHDWFVLTTGFKVGTMGTFSSDKDVPLYDRYFLGGGDSVRGFPYRSIGPVDNNEDNYGGQFMYILTAEVSHPIYDMLRGAFFVDVGDATSGNFGNITQPNVGIGYGLRIKLPSIDVPIRLDLAYPIVCNQEGVSRKLRFHFNMGFSL